MKRVDFSKGIRGKYSPLKLKIVGAVENLWAVCVTQKGENLIPLKLYRIEISQNSGEIKVKNEKGETVFYPKEWFAPLDVSKKTHGLLEKIA
ncbi:hypothetical protein BH20ACI4_BH20ACI4_31240 [soil metagenome]